MMGIFEVFFAWLAAQYVQESRIGHCANTRGHRWRSIHRLSRARGTSRTPSG